MKIIILQKYFNLILLVKFNTSNRNFRVKCNKSKTSGKMKIADEGKKIRSSLHYIK